MKRIFIIFSVLLLIYMVWPGPSKIEEFQPLPDSVKSTLSGDTTEIPNVAGYFSDNYRDSVIPFYRKEYWKLTKLPIPPLRLNYAPELSWNVIKKHTDSTYLEELVYPLRDSLYINGFEPFYEDRQSKYWGATKFQANDKVLYTKVTIRFYSSSIWIRVFVWAGITLSIFWLYKMTRKIIL